MACRLLTEIMTLSSDARNTKILQVTFASSEENSMAFDPGLASLPSNPSGKPLNGASTCEQPLGSILDYMPFFWIGPLRRCRPP